MMAEYIDRQKIQYREIVDYYDEQNMCEYHCDVADKVKIDRLPVANVVEREPVLDKIKQARQEIENLEVQIQSYHNDDPMISQADILAILDKLISEVEDGTLDKRTQ